MKLFNVIPQNLFNPLTGKNNQIVYDCLERIYLLCNSEAAWQIEKEIVIDDLKVYFENQIIFEDDEIDKTANDNPQSRASSTIRKLKEYGWIEEEFVGSILKLTVPSYTQMFLECMFAIIKNEETDYKTSIHNIYSIIINDENFREPYALVLKNVDNLMQELIKNLKKLNTNIKKHIDIIVLQKNPKDIIECLEKFYEEIISREFKRVKSDGNISRYKVKIIDKVEIIKETKNLLDLAILDCKQKENLETDDKAREKIEDTIYSIKNLFVSYENIMQNVDDRYKKYFCSVKEKIEFMLANDDNIKGKLEILLQNITKIYNRNKEDLFDYDELVVSIIKIYPQNFIGSDSLFVQPIRNKTAIAEMNTVFELTDEEKENLILEDIKKMQELFTQSNINKYVKNLLKKGESIYASKLNYLTERDDIRTMFLYLYAGNESSIYKINEFSYVVKCGSIEFKDFEIVRIK